MTLDVVNNNILVGNARVHREHRHTGSGNTSARGEHRPLHNGNTSAPINFTSKKPVDGHKPKNDKPSDKKITKLFDDTASQTEPLNQTQEDLAQQEGKKAFDRTHKKNVSAILKNENASIRQAYQSAATVSGNDFKGRVQILTSQLDNELQKQIGEINNSPASPTQKAEQIKKATALRDRLIKEFKIKAQTDQSQLQHDILFEDSSRTSTNLFDLVVSKFNRVFFPDKTKGLKAKIEDNANGSINALNRYDAAAIREKDKAIQDARKQLKEIPKDVAETFFLVANQMDVVGLCSGGISDSLTAAGLDDGDKLKGQANLAPEKLNTNKNFKVAKVTEDLVLNPPEGTLFVFKDAITPKWKQFGHIEMIVSNRPELDNDGKEVGRRIFGSSDHISKYRLSDSDNIDKLWKRDKDGNIMYENVEDKDGKPVRNPDGTIKRSRAVDSSKILAYTFTTEIKCDEKDCISPAKRELVQGIPKQIEALVYRVNHPRTQHIQDKKYKGYSKAVDIPDVLIERINKLQEIEAKYSDIIYSVNNPAALQDIPSQISKLIGELKNPNIKDNYKTALLARIATLQGYEGKSTDLIFSKNNPNVLQNVPKGLSALFAEYKNTKDDTTRGIIKDRIVFLEDIEQKHYSSIYDKDHIDTIKAVPGEIRNVLKEYKEVLKKDGYDDYKQLLKQRFYKLLGFEGNKFYLLYTEQKYTLPGFQEQMNNAVNDRDNPQFNGDDYKAMIWAQYGMLMRISTTEGNSVYNSKPHPKHKSH